MPQVFRIGLSPFPGDPFWWQVEAAVHRRAASLPVELVPLDDEAVPGLNEGAATQAEDLLRLELDALIGWAGPEAVRDQVLEAGVPIIDLRDTPWRHALSASPLGWSEGARQLAAFLAEEMAEQGRVLIVGADLTTEGGGPLAALQSVFADYPNLTWQHIPWALADTEAGPGLRAALASVTTPVNAILGLSETLALAARDMAQALNLLEPPALVAGLGGDPRALAALARGELTALVTLFPDEFGAQVLDLALHAARKGPLAPEFESRCRLVTARNITEVMAECLTAMASLPTWLAEAGQRRQRQRLNQLEASLEMIGRIQSTLNSQRQLREIVELICAEHGYDRAKIYRWDEAEQRLFHIHPSQPGSANIWSDLVDGSRADRRERPEDPAPKPGSLIIADGMGSLGDWYDLSGMSANSVVDQMATWATPESKAFARAFEARYGHTPSPTAAGLSYDYANMWLRIAGQVIADTGALTRAGLAAFIWDKLLAGAWCYTDGCVMREYRYSPETVPDPLVGPNYFTLSVLEYLDGEGTVIFPAETAEREAAETRASSPPPAAPAGPPRRVFKLGVLGPYTGLNAPVGAEMRGAVEMAFDRAGYRVGDYRIELVWIDCQSDAVLGSQAYEAAIVEQGIQAGLLNWHTAVALACMEVAARHQLPHFFALAGAKAINDRWRADPRKYYYWVKGWPEPAKLTANYVQTLEAAIARGLWQPETKTAAFWGEDTEWGRSFVAGMKAQLESAGWQTVAEDYFPLDQTDFVPWLTKITERRPALLAGTGSNPTTYASFVKQAHTLGLERMFTWSAASEPSISLEAADILGRALLRNEPVYMPCRGADDAAAAETRARLVLPIRHRGQPLGVLDLRSRRATWHTRLELVSLQVLADQLGLALWEAQLYGRAAQAKATAEQSDRSKTQLLANVSHELRTPLNIILGYTQRALDSFLPYQAELPAALVSDLERIHHSSEHLLHLANDLLDLSRNEIQELELYPRLIDPAPLLAEAFHSVAEAAARTPALCWRLDVPERLPLIHADPVRLRQVIFNLLSNAQRFTDRGHVTLGAEAAPPHLHIWVKDTGLGIPADRQGLIFEPFVTARHADRQREGTGLGLSIVRQLVALHHGQISLDSQVGEGSTFHVYLPLPDAQGERNARTPATPHVLLLVSDSDQLPDDVARFCRHQGLAPRRLSPGETLQALLAEVQPVAVAWDLACNSAAHSALLEKLRRHPAVAQLPLMVYGPAAAPATALPLGLTNFVLKPVETKSLLETIEAMRPAAAAPPILVVDDDPAARDYLARVLTQACPGFDIRVAENGALALAQMAREIPSLVILDLVMPTLDGLQVLEQMRASAATSRVPVLVMTGQTLTAADIRRLEPYALVTVHSKDMLSSDEIAAAVHHSLFGTDGLPPQTSALAKRAVAYFQQHYAQPLTRGEVARAIGVSQNYLSQIFRRELGLSPWDYLTRYRIKQAERLLRCTTDSISTIAAQVGFGDPAYFGRVFRAETGSSPSAYRTG